MKNIVIAATLLMAVTSQGIFAQNKTFTINGKVISFEESFPLEGVSVAVKGTKNVTGTQSDGTFSLAVTPGDKTLVVTLTGYETQELSITNARDYEIVLKRSNALAKDQQNKERCSP
jgi:hypothetical protein